MRFDLAQLTRRARNPRRSAITLRDIIPTGVQATDLYAIYRPVLDRWAAAIPALMAEYERTLNVISTTTQDAQISADKSPNACYQSTTLQDSAADLNATLDATEGEIQRLFYLLSPRLRDWVLRMETWQRGKWIGAVLSATGVDMQNLIGPEDVAETLEAVIARNIGLVKSVSAEARQRMGEAVFRGLTERKPAREVAAELREAVDMGRGRARRIASHQLSAVTSSLAQERRRQAGLDVFAWHHSRKLHPRKEHQDRDGDLYCENPELVGRKVGDKTIRAAPPADDRAGMRPGCGCRERGVLILDFD